jgi:hypothetical protein
VVVLATGLVRGEETPPEIEEILTREPESADYVEEQRCLSRSRIRRVEALGDHHVVFEMSRREYYLVEFKQRCPMLRKGAALSYETNGMRVCAHDYVRAIMHEGFGRNSLGPPCPIPSFQPVAREQIELLKIEIANPKKKDAE